MAARFTRSPMSETVPNTAKVSGASDSITASCNSSARNRRGVPPPDFAALGQEHVDRMRVLRPALLWPQPSADRRTQIPAVQRGPWDGAA